MRDPQKSPDSLPAGPFGAAGGKTPVLICGLLLLAIRFADAQAVPASTDQSVPEQPAWGARESTTPEDTVTLNPAPASPSPPDAPMATARPASARAVDLASPAPIAPSSPPGPGTASVPPAKTAFSDQVGVPESTNHFLPNFGDYGRPLFERQGLRFRAGPVNLRMGLSVGAEYNSNIYGSSTNLVSDYITRVSPEFNLGIGDFQARDNEFALLNYHPSFEYYLNQTQQNRVNQNLEITGQGTFSRYSTTADIAYTTSTSPNATQTGGQSYSTFVLSWDNRYYLGAKTFARAQVGANIQSSENGNDYQTYSISPQIGYAYSPKTTLTFGPFAGVSNISDGGRQSFQGLSVGINYTTLRKLLFDGSFGVQARQFDEQNATGASNFITPVFNIGVTWNATANTDFALTLLRDVQLSDIQRGLTYTNSQIDLRVSQKIYNRLTFGLGLTYQLLDYQGDAPIGRTDQYISGGPTLGYSFWRDLFNLSVFYRYQKRTSDVQQYQYDVTSYGFNLSYRF